MIIGTIFVILAIALAVALPRLMKMYEKRNTKNWTKTGKSRKQKLNPDKSQEYWGLKDVRNKTLYLKNGEHKAILHITPINTALMSDDEQTSVESALIGCVMGLSFPIQFTVTTSTIDTRQTTADLAGDIAKDVSTIRRAYTEQICAYLDAIQNTENVLTQEIYLTVSSSHTDPEKAVQELEHRCAIIIAGLSRANVIAKRLSSEAIVNYLHKQLNRTSRILPSTIIAAGGLNLYIDNQQKGDG